MPANTDGTCAPVSITDAATEKARRAKREWEERYNSLLVGRKHWKLIAFSECVIIAGLVVALWDTARRAHTPEAFMLERSGGLVSYVGPLQPKDMDTATWNMVRVEQLKKFISLWRTVTSDKVAQNANWDAAFKFVADNSQARTELADWYATNDPLKRSAKGELVSVQFKTFDPPLKDSRTYGLWWTERTTDTTGQTSTTKAWHARIVYTEKVPTDEYSRSVNGLGILATELSFEPVLGDQQ